MAKVRNKSFIVLTVLSPIVIVAMIALVVYLTKINNAEKRVITVLDESAFFEPQFTEGTEASYVSMKDVPLNKAIDSVHAAGHYGLIYIPKGNAMDTVAKQIKFYTQGSPRMEVLRSIETKIEHKIREYKLQALNVPPSVLNELEKKYEISIVNFSGEKNLKGINELKAFIGGGFGYLIMMFIIIYGAFVMRSVIEEKTSRIIEVIISSVRPFQLMLGKILGTSLAGITQFIIWIVSAGFLGYLVLTFMGVEVDALHTNTNASSEAIKAMSQSTIQLYVNELVKIPWGVLLTCFLLYFCLGYLIYSSIYAAIGAAVDNETDTQQFMFPVISPLILAIYVGFFSVFENPHGPIAVAFSLFPLTSPIVMLMRLPNGVGEDGVPWWQLITSIIFLILTFLFIVWVAAKVYRVGILMYGKKPSYKEIYKWLKYK